MKPDEFLNLLRRLCDEGIEVHEQIAMEHVGGKPLLDEDGIQVINDVVKVGDARLYIDRDDNDLETAQEIVTFLAKLDEFLPEIIAALEARWENT